MRIPINKDDKIVEFLYKSLPQHSETDYIILEIVCKHLEKSSEELFACLKVNLKLNIPVIPDKDLKYTIKLINSSDIKNKELIYTSEHHKNKKEFSFNETYLNKIVFLSKFAKQTYRLEFYEKNTNNLYGKTDNLHIEDLKNSKSDFPLKGTQGILGKIKFMYSEKKKSSFLNYFETGLQISLIVGIDYTSSNLAVTDKNSLHYLSDKKLNPYEMALLNCGTILSYYDYDQKFPVYGFGGIPEWSQEVSHCFNVNMKKDTAEVTGVEGIIKYYRKSLSKVKLFGPTCFHKIILKILNKLKSIPNTELNNYYVLMLITDGKINDMRETIDVVVEACKYPLSIIIIGVGESDFSEMKTLGNILIYG